MKKRYVPVLYGAILALGIIFHGVFMAQAQDKSVDHQMINLYPKGPRSQTLTIKIATPVLGENKDALECLARRLLEQKVLEGPELQNLLAVRTGVSVVAFSPSV